MFNHFHESKWVELNLEHICYCYNEQYEFVVFCDDFCIYFFLLFELLMSIQLDMVQDYYHSLVWFVRNRDITHTHTFRKERKNWNNETKQRSKKNSFCVFFFRGLSHRVLQLFCFLFDFNHELFFISHSVIFQIVQYIICRRVVFM